MAVSSFDNLLSLDEWARIFGIAPEYFNGFDRTGRTLSANCSSVWFQYPWADDGDRLGREEVAEAIHQAEEMLIRELGFAPAPTWIENEWHDYPRLGVRPLYGRTGQDAYSQRKAVKLNLGKVIAGGQRATTLISSGVAVTYSSSDGNTSGYQDRATISVATTVTDPCEIQVFFRTTDGAPSAAHQRYRIRPLSVSISGGVATIVGDRSLFVSPEIHEFQNASFTAANIGAADANFVQTVDVYRVYNDTNGNNNQQGVLVWETEPQNCPDPPCSSAEQTLCLGLRDRELGWVTPYATEWNATDSAYEDAEYEEDREPDRIRVNYYSGVPRELGADLCRMNRRYALMVARLSMTLLPKATCGCAQAERQMQYWFNVPDPDTQDTPILQLDNPFGQGRGALYAWREVTRERNGEGILVA